MIFLTDIDLQSHAFQRFINESKGDENISANEVIDTLEKQNIDLIKMKLNGRYDVAAIFAHTGAGRHFLIVKILTNLVLYDLFRRNAARKVPEDIQENYEWAMKLLENIKAGKEQPVGLDIIKDAEGEPVPTVIWGNNSNKNYYI